MFDTQDVLLEIEQFSNACPKNTKAMGYAIPMVYYELGWDTGYYFIDFADLTVNSITLDYIQKEINQINEPFVIDRDALNDLTKNGIDMSIFNSKMEAKNVYYVGLAELIYWEPVNYKVD